MVCTPNGLASPKTTNVRDFIELLDVHPGLLVLCESGLSRTEQWDRQLVLDST
jgi:hypothetical protein